MSPHTTMATATPDAADWRFENRHARFARMKQSPRWATRPAFMQPWTVEYLCHQLIRAFFHSLSRGIAVDAVHPYLEANQYLRAEGWEELQIHRVVRAVAERLRLPAEHPERQLDYLQWTASLAELGRQPAVGVQRIDGLTAQELLGAPFEGSAPTHEGAAPELEPDDV